MHVSQLITSGKKHGLRIVVGPARGNFCSCGGKKRVNYLIVTQTATAITKKKKTASSAYALSRYSMICHGKYEHYSTRQGLG